MGFLDTTNMLDLFPNGEKVVHLCTDDKSLENLGNELLKMVGDELAHGWILWKMEEPEIADNMIRVKCLMRKVND